MNIHIQRQPDTPLAQKVPVHKLMTSVTTEITTRVVRAA